MSVKSQRKGQLKFRGRIPVYSKEIRHFVKFLNKYSPLKQDVDIVVFNDAEINEEKDGAPEAGDNDPKPYFGLYHPLHSTIWLAVGQFYPVYKTFILVILAHEVYHAIQHQKKVSFNERNADAWAVKVVLQYIRHQWGNVK